MWTPKSWSFDNFHEVGYFPTWFTFSLKAIKWLGLLMGGHERPGKLVPSLGIKGYGFHDQFHIVMDCGS